jgi:hypothetical protein
MNKDDLLKRRAEIKASHNLNKSLPEKERKFHPYSVRAIHKIMEAYQEVCKSHGEYYTRIKRIELYIDVSVITEYSPNYCRNVICYFLKEKGVTLSR